MELQHDYHELIISAVHSHLDHDMCLKAVVVRGMLKRAKELADHLIGIKGVQHKKTNILRTQCDTFTLPRLTCRCAPAHCRATDNQRGLLVNDLLK